MIWLPIFWVLDHKLTAKLFASTSCLWLYNHPKVLKLAQFEKPKQNSFFTSEYWPPSRSEVTIAKSHHLSRTPWALEHDSTLGLAWVNTWRPGITCRCWSFGIWFLSQFGIEFGAQTEVARLRLPGSKPWRPDFQVHGERLLWLDQDVGLIWIDGWYPLVN